MVYDLHRERWTCLVSGKKVRVPQRRHYRLVEDIVGRPLKTVRGTEELLHAIYDVFTGMLTFSCRFGHYSSFPQL